MTESFDSCPARRVTSVPPVRRATTHPGVTMQYETNSGFSATAQRVAARSACPARLQRPQSPLRKRPSRPVHFLSLGRDLHSDLAAPNSIHPSTSFRTYWFTIVAPECPQCAARATVLSLADVCIFARHHSPSYG